MAGLTTDSKAHHHDFSPSITTNENKAIRQLRQTIKSYTGPLSLGDNAGSNTDLYNLVTKKAVCKKTKKDLVQQGEIGQKLFSSFVVDRVKSGKVNLWAVMKKCKLQTWKSNKKVFKVKTVERVVESAAESSTSSMGSSDVTVAIVYGIAEVQSLDKPYWIKTCKNLAKHFIDRIFIKYNNTEQIRLIFDRYDVLRSSLLLREIDKALKNPFATISPIQLMSLKLP